MGKPVEVICNGLVFATLAQAIFTDHNALDAESMKPSVFHAALAATFAERVTDLFAKKVTP